MPIRQDNINTSVDESLTASFQRTISPERWRTYKLSAGFHEETAQKLYLWNAAIGQSFHFPLQTVEVAIRNVTHETLKQIYGNDWSSNQACHSIIGDRLVQDIARSERRHRNRYNNVPNTPQIVASLSLGFWISLLRQTYHRPIWEDYIDTAFPNLSDNETMADVSRIGTEIQNLRNRIFHQEPLIGNNLSQDYASIIRMMGWICSTTRDWMRKHSSVPAVIRERPRRK